MTRPASGATTWRWRAPILVASIALIAGLAGGPAGARATKISPQALYNALLTTPVAKLPHGYESPIVGKHAMSARAKAHHAIGAVEIEADGGNVAVFYIVFRTTADAKADFSHASLAGTATAKAPSSIPRPSVVVNTSATGTSGGKNVTFGLTDIACVYGNVIIEAATSSTTSAKHGDVAGAVALELFAIKHLKRLSGLPA